MTLKNKLSFFVSLFFTVIFAISATTVYFLFADFRQEEFEDRLKEKALSSIKLLVEVEQVDKQLLSIIDQNSINKLYKEKTLIFDANYELIYSSLDDTKIKWSVDDLKYLKANKTFFRKEKAHEVYGVFYDTNSQDYYALISAADDIGNRKLEYLLYILIATYIISTVVCWFAADFLVKYLLSPLDVFHIKLKGINENNLDTQIVVKEKKDEIDLLADEFNQMLKRISVSYKKQKEFTANASHELRTPISRIIVQLENKISAEKNAGISTGFNEHILNDINQLSELINSLLLLSKAEGNSNIYDEHCRIDEIIYESFEKLNKVFPDFTMELDILEMEALEVSGNKSLLVIAFTNLLKNAYLYSETQQAHVRIESVDKKLIVTISNDGKILSERDRENLFQSFMRGENSKNKTGLGLGLRIVQRILLQSNAQIHYHPNTIKANNFILTFSL